MAETGLRGLARFALAVGLIASTALLAFIAGTAVAGRYLVPPGQGLAAPVEAMAYGLLAALLAAALSGSFAWTTSFKLLVRTTGLTMLAAVALCAGLFMLREPVAASSNPSPTSPTTTTPPPLESRQ